MNATHTARVRVTGHPLWRLRARSVLGRTVFYLAVVAGLAASARYAIDPPRASVSSAAAGWRSDPAGEWLARLFVQSYLTWDGSDPAAHERALGQFLSPDADPDAGLRPPPSGTQRIQRTEVVQARARSGGDHVYTVAALTAENRLLYVSVEVLRTAGGLEIAGYPAFVGPPTTRLSELQNYQRLRDVTDSSLSAVVARALTNYLGGAAGELAADLAPGADVSLPTIALALEHVDALKWQPDGESALAVVHASSSDGADFTLEYELDVARPNGRWEIGAIQMNPTA